LIKHKKHQGLFHLALGGILALFITGCATTPEPEPEPVVEPEPVSEPAPAPVEEPEIVIKPSAPETYIVVKGDTLWDISTKFLRDPWYWPEIWYGNPQIANPHLIYPGDVITLYYVGGKPRLAVNGGPRVEGLPSNKLEPQIRRESIGADDFVIPIQAIQSFLIRPDVLDKKTIDDAPYIFGTQEGRLIYGTGYTVYAHDMPDAKVGDQYDVYHPNKELRDPETGKSPNFWSRAMGWYMMAIVDVLDYLPEDHPKRDSVVSILQQTADALVKVSYRPKALPVSCLELRRATCFCKPSLQDLFPSFLFFYHG